MNESNPHYCPYCKQETFCPFLDEQRNKLDKNLNSNLEEFELFYNQYYLGETRAAEEEVTRILQLLYNNQPQLFSGFNIIMRNYLRSIISFTLDNASKYPGNINQKTNNIYDDFRIQYASLIASIRAAGVPNNIINRTFKNVIEFTLRNSEIVTPPFPVPPPSPGDRWSQWEDLGGILTTSPGVSSWAENRLDTFVAGSDNALYHKWWDGSRWSDWENLGGILTSAPGAVSWGPNRIDVFVRGTTNSMYHKWWDGSRWSDWENLGGILTSAPAASSWAANRIDTFVRGSDNALYHKWWNGSSWSEFENLGGILTSSPAALRQ